MKHRTKYIYAALLILAGVAMSCQKEDDDSNYKLRDIAVKATFANSSIPVTWESGDQVKVFFQNGHQLSGQSTLTTDDGITFRESSYIEDVSKYWIVSPAAAANLATPESLYASLPTVQAAKADGVSSSAALSMSVTSSLEGTVTFEPVVSFLRFSLSGSMASSVTQVIVSSTEDYLSGDLAVKSPGKSGTITADHDRGFSTPSRQVMLSGSFREGSSYYIAIIPGTFQKGLTVSFTDRVGSGIVRNLDAGIKADSGEVIDLGTINMGDHFETNLNVTQIMTATKGKKPTTLIFAPEGFVEGSGKGTREEFEEAARSGAEFIFSVEPYKSMKEYFNVYIAWKASETGKVGGTFGVREGLDYSGYWGLAGTDRDPVYNWAKEIVPDWRDGVTDVDDGGILLLINGRTWYGSVCWWEDSGRFIALTNFSPDYLFVAGYTQVGEEYQGFGTDGYMVDDGTGNNTYHTLSQEEYASMGYKQLWSGSGWYYAGSWRNVLLHEAMGHGFGRLQDEYWSGYTNRYTGTAIDADQRYDPPRALNLSRSMTDYPWKKFEQIVRDEYLPRDARYGRIGLWQGGLVQYQTGIWRSEIIDCMKDERPYFSAWNRAVIYQRLMRTSGESPSFDVVNNESDIRSFLDHDIAVNGAFDRIRGE